MLNGYPDMFIDGRNGNTAKTEIVLQSQPRPFGLTRVSPATQLWDHSIVQALSHQVDDLSATDRRRDW